jgi:hypothetical protein
VASTYARRCGIGRGTVRDGTGSPWKRRAETGAPVREAGGAPGGRPNLATVTKFPYVIIDHYALRT